MGAMDGHFPLMFTSDVDTVYGALEGPDPLPRTWRAPGSAMQEPQGPVLCRGGAGEASAHVGAEAGLLRRSEWCASVAFVEGGPS